MDQEKKLDDDILNLLEDDILYDKNLEETEEDETEKLNETEKKFHEEIKNKSEHLKNAMKGENPEICLTILDSMNKWENPTYKEEKFKFREKLSQNFWSLYREIAAKIANKSFSKEKRDVIKYGIIDTDYLKERQIETVQTMEETNTKFESDSIFTADEWFYAIAKGDVPTSVLDETLTKKKGPNKEKLESKRGQLEAEIQSAKLKIDKILTFEEEMKDMVGKVTEHSPHPDFNDSELIECYMSSQRESLTIILEAARKLLSLDRQLSSNYRIVEKIQYDLARIEKAFEEGEDFDEISELVYNEFLSFRQMVKMCAGRQGNHFPILHKQYFNEDPINIATKESVSKIITDVEKLDPSVFFRTYKGEDHRIEPYFLIVPSYGDKGICWEPFSRSNRATSKGRLIIPMLPKNLKVSVLTAIADLRWQVAKEKAQHYWMEEGLTGYYYEYFTKEKLKGDIKKHFVNDYILWIAYESRGIQKQHKDVRPIFWRYIPFPDKIKDSLKNRGFYYNELYKKDQNRMRSDGY